MTMLWSFSKERIAKYQRIAKNKTFIEKTIILKKKKMGKKNKFPCFNVKIKRRMWKFCDNLKFEEYDNKELRQYIIQKFLLEYELFTYREASVVLKIINPVCVVNRR